MENYDPKGIVKNEEDWMRNDQDDYLAEIIDNLFHISPFTEEDSIAKTLCCKHCGGKTFNVGTSYLFTAVKCVVCEYEVCVHDG